MRSKRLKRASLRIERWKSDRWRRKVAKGGEEEKSWASLTGSDSDLMADLTARNDGNGGERVEKKRVVVWCKIRRFGSLEKNCDAIFSLSFWKCGVEEGFSFRVYGLWVGLYISAGTGNFPAS